MPARQARRMARTAIESVESPQQISREVVDVTDDDKRQTGRLDRWRAKRRLKRKQRANRPPPLLDPQLRAREESRRDSPAASHDSSASGAGFGAGDGS
jgi:hypothetical protein